MKKFNYFLLTAMLVFITSINLNAFTASSALVFPTTNDFIPLHVHDISFGLSTVGSHLEFNELEFTSSSTNNLKFLYSICIGLVLFNLIVQIKIIVQMVHLFFQVRKKDEYSNFSF